MAQEYGPNIVTDGLVLSLDAADKNSYPGSGTTWSDLSGNGNDGTLTNGPTFDSGNGGSIVFDGSNDYINLPYEDLCKDISTMSYSLWFQVAAADARQGLISTHDQSGGSHLDAIEIEIQANNNSFVGFRNANTTFYSAVHSTPYTLNTWHHLTGVITTTQIEYYKNGELVEINASWPDDSLVINSPSETLLLGRYYTAYLNGKIAISRVYDRALSAKEVSQNFNAQRSRFGI
jgi:hypothetical protein